MTELDLYTSALIEQNKLEAPTVTIEEYNYLINKAITQYINLTYVRYDWNQQSSDDLRWLQKSAELDIVKQNKLIPPMEEANYACVLPNDYLHILNCVVHFSPTCKSYKDTYPCKLPNDDGSNGIFSLCRRLDADQFPSIIKNAYLKPSYKNPYFYINTSTEGGKGTAIIEEQKVLNPCNDCEKLNWKNDIKSVLDPCNENYTNPDPPKNLSGNVMEIRCGKGNGFYPDIAYVDYLRRPREINLTWKDVQSVKDTTRVCEFPDYVGYEIINLFVKLLLENASDERLRTYLAVNQTLGGIPQTDSK